MEDGPGPRRLGAAVAEDGARLAFTRATVSVILTDPRIEGNPIVYVNDAFGRLTGYDASAVIGRNCRFLQGPDTDPAAIARLREAVERREEVSVEMVNYRADGTAFLNRMVVSPVRDEAGRLTHFLGIQKGAELTGRADAALRPMSGADVAAQLALIQHRVRNHLAMIVGMIRLQGRDSAAAGEFTALSHRIESLQILYEELTGPAPEARSQDVVALGTYVTRIVHAVAYLDGRPGIRVNVAAVDATIGVDAAARIGLLASELLTNALRHAFDGRHFGSVELRLDTLAGGGIRMTVSDDGVGIDPVQDFPDEDRLGGRIIGKLVEALGGSLGILRGATGTVVALDVPASGLGRIAAAGRTPRRSVAGGEGPDED